MLKYNYLYTKKMPSSFRCWLKKDCLKPRVQSIHIVDKQHVPRWLHVPYIECGYVYPNLTTRQCFQTLFMKTNQTLNAWTMIAGVIASSCLFIWACAFKRCKVAVFALLYLSCLVHAPFSVANHLLRHKNEESYRLWKRLDVVFIYVSSVMLTCCLSWYVFPFEVTIGLMLFASYLCFQQIQHVKNEVYGIGHQVDKTKHVLMLLGVVIVYLVPVIFSVIFNPKMRILGSSIILCLGVSSLVYMSSFPEKYAPYKFDIIGASHQLLHVGIIIAHVLEFLFIYNL